jgi:hypothetical protein
MWKVADKPGTRYCRGTLWEEFSVASSVVSNVKSRVKTRDGQARPNDFSTSRRQVQPTSAKPCNVLCVLCINGTQIVGRTCSETYKQTVNLTSQRCFLYNIWNT